ncbi:hypothetical protein EI94DRAFT_1704448 [Lactarius quietus]|nr:hypothetical protein EI94DRAFT_1704448 [Lactarius quietus]
MPKTRENPYPHHGYGFLQARADPTRRQQWHLWLQQDFNLYLIQMFDTFHAWKRYTVLRLLSRQAIPARRLAHLPCRVPTVPNAFVRDGLSRSVETALRVYALDPYDAEGGTGFNGWDTLARRLNKAVLGVDGEPNVQRGVFRAVHVWRDRVAREEDESTGSIRALEPICVKLVEQPPADMAALLHALPSMPPVVRGQAKELLVVIRDAMRKWPSGPAALREPTPVLPAEVTPESKEEVEVASEQAPASSSLCTLVIALTVPQVRVHFASPLHDLIPATVGQRQKKRKHAKKAGTAADNNGNGKKETTAKAEEVTAVPFDFESAPNILDDGADEEEDGRAGKRKGKKRGVLDRRDFPAAPKDRRERKVDLARLVLCPILVRTGHPEAGGPDPRSACIRSRGKHIEAFEILYIEWNDATDYLYSNEVTRDRPSRDK